MTVYDPLVQRLQRYQRALLFEWRGRAHDRDLVRQFVIYRRAVGAADVYAVRLVWIADPGDVRDGPVRGYGGPLVAVGRDLASARGVVPEGLTRRAYRDDPADFVEIWE